MSFNLCKKIEGIETLVNIEKLYLLGNMFKIVTFILFYNINFYQIENLGVKPKCWSLELGDNKLRAIENLGGLMNLKELFLAKNKIETIERLPNYQHLKIISLQVR